MSELLVVFDVGTTGSRTIIIDINGKEIAGSKLRVKKAENK